MDFTAGEQKQSEKLKSVYTFGAPRVFAGGSSANAYNEMVGKKTLHVVFDSDLISGIPPASIGFERTGNIAKIPTWGFPQHSRYKYQDASKGIVLNEVNIRAATKNSTAIWADFRLYLNELGSRVNDFWRSVIQKSIPLYSLPAPIEQITEQTLLNLEDDQANDLSNNEEGRFINNL